MARRTKEEAQLTRESLLKAALSVFSKKGFASTTLEDIAKEAGVTRGAVYWHFGSKAELYNALLETYSVKSGDVVKAAAAEGGGFVDILRRIFIRLLESVETDTDLRKVMEISLFKTERTPELLDARHQQIESTRSLIESIAQALRQGSAGGELRKDIDPVEMARAFLAFNQGAISLWLNDPASFSLKECAPVFADIYISGILQQ